MGRITVEAETDDAEAETDDAEALADHLEHLAGKLREGYYRGHVEGEYTWRWESDPDRPTEAVVKFYPQVWDENDYALTGAPFTFTVPYEDALNDDGELVEDSSHESDLLRNHENAPEVVQKWQGPFYVVVNEVR